MVSPKSSLRHLVLFIFKHPLLLSTGSFSLISLVLLIVILKTGDNFINKVKSLFTISSPLPKADVSRLIVQQIQGVSELTTSVFVMEAVVPTSADRKLGNLVIGTTKLLYIAQGEVRAGIDLSKLEIDDVKVSDNTVEIHLPPPQILDSKIDVERSQVYDYDRGFLGLGPDVAPQLQTLAQRETLNKIVATACTKGLLKEANERAELAITQLLTTIGYKQVEVETTPPSKDCKFFDSNP